ncbi:high light inducible protein [Fortiea contorta]|uniref:high light inducible protein n=1 Tax=Fortiea contorta TaxID=1892405 RepID=UPI00034DA759|nr:high light inducible protein [Fortiea contorta]
MTAKGFTINDRGLLNNYAIEPKVYVDESNRAGFTEYAEKLNGRLAMIGFVSLIALEVITGHGLIGWLTSL